MRKRDKTGKEFKELLLQVELMLKKDGHQFFDLYVFEEMIEHFFNVNELDKALKLCNIAIDQYPFSIELLLNKSKALSSLGKSSQAFEVINKAELLNPCDSEILYFKGLLFSITGDYDSAIAYYDKALSQTDDIEKPDLLFSIGFAHQAQAEFDIAIKFYQEVLLLDKSHEDAVYEAIFCFEMEDKTKEGLQFFENLIDADPYSCEAWYNLGIFELEIGNYKKAIYAFEYAVLIDKAYSAAYYQMGNAYVDSEDHKNAFSCFLEVTKIEEEPDAEVFYLMGKCLEEQSNFKKAIKFYKQSIESENDFEDAWFGIGNCLLKENKWFEATHYLNKATHLNPNNIDYYLALARSEYQLGNILASEEAFKKAAYIAPNETTIWLEWSMVFYQENEIENAVDLILEGLETSPDNADLLYRLSAYYFAAGKLVDAARQLELALIINFDKHEVLYTFFTDIKMQKSICKLVNHYKDRE